MKSKIETSYGKTKIYKKENPEARKWVMLVPGYSEGIAHNKDLVDSLADERYNAVAYDQPRKSGKATDPLERQGQVAHDVYKSSIPEGERSLLVGHSLGAAAIRRVVEENPEMVDGVILLQPAGATDNMNLGEQSVRVGEKVARNQAEALMGQNPHRTPEGSYRALADTESAPRYSSRVAKAQLAGGSVLAKNPKLALREANAAGNYDITDDIKAIKELGVPVSVVASHSDELFDADKVDQWYEEKGAELVDSYSVVADPEARHDTSWMQRDRTVKIIKGLDESAERAAALKRRDQNT